METDEIVKEIRTLLALKHDERNVLAFLNELGYNDEEAKQLLQSAGKYYAIDKDLEMLRSRERQSENVEEEEKELTEEEKRARYVKDQIGDIQDIIKTMKSDIRERPGKKKP